MFGASPAVLATSSGCLHGSRRHRASSVTFGKSKASGFGKSSGMFDTSSGCLGIQMVTSELYGFSASSLLSCVGWVRGAHLELFSAFTFHI